MEMTFKAGEDYTERVLDWAVAAHGESVLLKIVEDQEVFAGFCMAYNAAYEAFVDKFLNQSDTVRKAVLLKSAFSVYKRLNAEAHAERSKLIAADIERRADMSDPWLAYVHNEY